MTKTSNHAGRDNAQSRSYLMLGTGAVAMGAVAGIIWFGAQTMIGKQEPADTARVTPSVQSAPATITQPAPPAATGPADPAPLFSQSLVSAEPAEQPAVADEPDSSVPYDLETIAYSLGQLTIGDDGHVVLDHTAHQLLEEAFLYSEAPIDEAQMNELRAMIEAGLGEEAGERASDIAERFYRYSSAYKEIEDILGMRNDPVSISNDYEQLARLRRTHLGNELAEQLYGEEETLTRYTLEVMKIQNDPDLSPEERKRRQQSAADKAGVMLSDGAEQEAEATQDGS
ncbi:lipase secretion chaperone [uncultured Marinobacter sp.]|uniref:lipase secretion chaperone n=1 Tax=uncultured Marinobacter sp. TaxID=187379 RepID=UPI0030D96CF0